MSQVKLITETRQVFKDILKDYHKTMNEVHKEFSGKYYASIENISMTDFMKLYIELPYEKRLLAPHQIDDTIYVAMIRPYYNCVIELRSEVVGKVLPRPAKPFNYN